MTHELEKHLIDMGILPATTLEALEDDFTETLQEPKNYFNDPRDPITGEVPF